MQNSRENNRFLGRAGLVTNHRGNLYHLIITLIIFLLSISFSIYRFTSISSGFTTITGRQRYGEAMDAINVGLFFIIFVNLVIFVLLSNKYDMNKGNLFSIIYSFMALMI
ncbi:MAG: hypothetical protein ACXAC7_23715, partial [Candidatus Hodarchaeales archaeon]